MSFGTFNFHPSIMAGVRTLGYVTFTPIQLQSTSSIMQGRDALEHLFNARLEHRTLQSFDYTISAPASEYIRSPRQLPRRTLRNERIGSK
jgi:hypothetical protein